MGKISHIKRKISQYLESKSISRYEFYKNTGISRGTLDKETGLNEENLTKIFATYTDINPNWLILDEGEMLRVTNNNYANHSGTNGEKVKEEESSQKGTTSNPCECKECQEKQKQINTLMQTLNKLLSENTKLLEESAKDRELLRSLILNNSDQINKQRKRA